MDMKTFILLIVFGLVDFGIIYLFAKKVVGKGDIRGVMEDPHSRNRVIWVGAAIVGITIVIIVCLSVVGVMKWSDPDDEETPQDPRQQQGAVVGLPQWNGIEEALQGTSVGIVKWSGLDG